MSGHLLITMNSKLQQGCHDAQAHMLKLLQVAQIRLALFIEHQSCMASCLASIAACAHPNMPQKLRKSCQAQP